MSKLNCDEARRISIVDYLGQCGFRPQYIKGDNYWYRSPLREENTASFKVNTKINAWFDHGTGIGGNFIDLGIRLHQCTVEQLLSRLSTGRHSFSFHQPIKAAEEQPEHKIKVIQVAPLQNLTLVKYLHERAIEYYTAKVWCKEVLFTLNEQRHLAIGFQNNSGGYELRNAQLKLSSSPKDLTYISNGANTVHVFEGFTDFLSLLTLQGRDMPGNFLVLNSLSFVGKSLDILRQQNEIKLYLDHDNAAMQAVKAIKQAVFNAEDASRFYSSYKDLNAYLKIQQQSRGLEL